MMVDDIFVLNKQTKFDNFENISDLNLSIASFTNNHLCCGVSYHPCQAHYMNTVNWECSHGFSHRWLQLCLMNWIHISSVRHLIAGPVSNGRCRGNFWSVTRNSLAHIKPGKALPLSHQWKSNQQVGIFVWYLNHTNSLNIYHQGNSKILK